jgi:hypothetical protein
MTLVIRRPARGNVGKPDIAIFRLRRPVAIVIQVFVSDDISRNISSGPCILISVVSVIAPVVEIIRRANILHLSVQRVCAVECGALSRVHGICLPVPRRLAFSFANTHNGVGSVFTSLYAVAARLVDGERLIWSINLKDFVAV